MRSTGGRSHDTATAPAPDPAPAVPVVFVPPPTPEANADAWRRWVELCDWLAGIGAHDA